VYISLECGRVAGGLRRHGERGRALGASTLVGAKPQNWPAA